MPVPVKQLQPVTTPTPERKHRPTGRLLPQHILRKCRQTSDPFPHIRHAASQIHANAGARTDYAASTERMIAVSTTGSIVLSKCKQRPPRRRNSITVGRGGSVIEA